MPAIRNCPVVHLCPPSQFASLGPSAQRKKSHSHQQEPGHIPRPRNAFFIFRSWFYANGAAELPAVGKLNQQNLSKQVGIVWNGLSEEDRKPFLRMAEQEKITHAAKYPGYIYAPGGKASGSKSKPPASAKAKRKRRVLVQEAKSTLSHRRTTSKAPVGEGADTFAPDENARSSSLDSSFNDVPRPSSPPTHGLRLQEKYEREVAADTYPSPPLTPLGSAHGGSSAPAFPMDKHWDADTSHCFDPSTEEQTKQPLLDSYGTERPPNMSIDDGLFSSSWDFGTYKWGTMLGALYDTGIPLALDPTPIFTPARKLSTVIDFNFATGKTLHTSDRVDKPGLPMEGMPWDDFAVPSLEENITFEHMFHYINFDAVAAESD